MRLGSREEISSQPSTPSTGRVHARAINLIKRTHVSRISGGWFFASGTRGSSSERPAAYLPALVITMIRPSAYPVVLSGGSRELVGFPEVRWSLQVSSIAPNKKTGPGFPWSILQLSRMNVTNVRNYSSTKRGTSLLKKSLRASKISPLSWINTSPSSLYNVLFLEYTGLKHKSIPGSC